MSAPRQWQMARALESVRQLSGMLPELTDEEILACLQTECDTRRRKSVIDRLVATSAERNRQLYIKQLQEQYSWHVQNQSSSPRPKRSP